LRPPRTELTGRLADWQGRADAVLDRVLPPASTTPGRLHAAMRYAVLGGGKRIRMLLTWAACAAVGAAPARANAAAAAVELIHAYSLIHDDLPAMDDDDLRRGRPTCHVAFDEATAILAGDALQALAFEVLATDPHLASDPPRLVDLIVRLGRACGSFGMAGGQAADLEAVGRALDLDALARMHRLKTGALIRAAVALGARAGGEDDIEVLGALDSYADHVGLAFQIRDDVLDVEGATATIGKRQGADAARDKPTYVSLLGIDGARAALEAERTAAHRALDDAVAASNGRVDPADLRDLADFAADRCS
jgi:farnesyl diphosphate synthase